MHDTSGVGQVFGREWPRLVSSLVRDFRDVDLAEEAAQDAFLAAAEVWAARGRPDSPGAWLLTTARRKAIDRIRREQRFARYAESIAQLPVEAAEASASPLVDEQLALLLGCCHPALGQDAQVVLTLRLVGGLSTDQIARAYLVSTSTMTRRLSRAKKKIRSAGIPFGAPDADVLVDRLAAVHRVIYLIFTEGHASTSATQLIRGDLCDEAIWLATTVASFVPDDPEAKGLVALLMLIDARRSSRVRDGVEVLLGDQDRSLWDGAAIERGLAHLADAHRLGSLGPFQIQAAIAALHATAESFEVTDWQAVVQLYDLLARRDQSPVIALNRAIAVSYLEGPSTALALIDDLAHHSEMVAYPYFHSARAELLNRCGRPADALHAFDEATKHSTNQAQAASLRRRRQLVAGAAEHLTHVIC